MFKNIYSWFFRKTIAKTNICDYDRYLSELITRIESDTFKMCTILTYEKSFIFTKNDLISYMKVNTKDYSELLIYEVVLNMINGETIFTYNSGKILYNINLCERMRKMDKKSQDYNHVIMHHYEETFNSCKHIYRNYMRKQKLLKIKTINYE